MSRIVYVNGEFLPEEDAKISIFDRGFLFADAVYEVSAVLTGKLVENKGHLQRLRRSLKELKIDAPDTDAEIEAIQKQLITLNNLQEGLVYMQVSRGTADRDFAFPVGIRPSLVMFTQAKSNILNPIANKGISVVTTPDIRWGRRDIKTVGLLAACMSKMIAKEFGADDAWLLDNKGLVTEGSSNNAYIVKMDGTIVTRKLSTDILHGITRKAVLALAMETNISIEERSFTPAESYEAAEAFVTSASIFVLPVVKIDGNKIGNGKPGPIASRLRELYIEMALGQLS